VAPQSSFCGERKRLLDAYLAAMHEVLTLQDQELVAFARVGEGLDRFDLALELARGKRDAAKKACMQHIEAHGC